MSQTKNPAAVALGKLAKGHPKHFSQAELARRRDRMLEINKARKRDNKRKST